MSARPLSSITRCFHHATSFHQLPVFGWSHLTPLGSAHAFTLSSIGVDFHVTQVVDDTKGIHSMIPKNLFKTIRSSYWYKP